MTQQTPPSLLDALLRLEQHAEGRRVARTTLTTAVERLEAALARALRIGDAVQVDGRTIAVRRIGYIGSQGEGWPSVRCPRDEQAAALCLDGDVLSHMGLTTTRLGEGSEAPRWWDGHNTQRATGAIYDVATDEPTRFASAADLAWFAGHAAAIVAAFGDLLKADREQMTTAAEQARTQRV